MALALALALLLATVPAAVISVSGRYQQIVRYGDPYIVVYVQEFGAALLLAAGLASLQPRISGRWTQAVAVGLLALVCAWTVSVNKDRIRRQNDQFLVPRQQTEDLLGAGILGSLPAGSLLVVDSPYLWETQGPPASGLCSTFFSQHSGKRLLCLDAHALRTAQGTADLSAYPAAAWLRRLPPAADGAGQIELILRDERRRYRILAGKVHEVAAAQGPSVVPLLTSGFYGWEPTGRKDFAWSGGAARLSLWNLGRASGFVLRLRVESAVPQEIRFGTGAGDIAIETFRAGESRDVELRLQLAEGPNPVTFTPGEASVKVPGDTRTFSFRLTGISVTE